MGLGEVRGKIRRWRVSLGTVPTLAKVRLAGASLQGQKSTVHRWKFNSGFFCSVELPGKQQLLNDLAFCPSGFFSNPLASVSFS